MNRPETLILGYPGRLARAFAWLWPQASRAGRADFDITDRAAVLKAITERAPRRVINCAALTDLARCEREPRLAWAVNVQGVRYLAEACQAAGAVLVRTGAPSAASVLRPATRSSRPSSVTPAARRSSRRTPA